MSHSNFETRDAPTLADGEAAVIKAIDDFIAHMQADPTVKHIDMIVNVLPKDGTQEVDENTAATAKLLQQLYTAILIDRIAEKGLYYLLRR